MYRRECLQAQQTSGPKAAEQYCVAEGLTIRPSNQGYITPSSKA